VLNIQLPFSYVSKVSLQLYSIDGKYISTFRPASNTVQLNVRNLPGGTYLVKLVNGNSTEVYPFVKQ
jgi:hypothetical protein